MEGRRVVAPSPPTAWIAPRSCAVVWVPLCISQGDDARCSSACLIPILSGASSPHALAPSCLAIIVREQELPQEEAYLGAVRRRSQCILCRGRSRCRALMRLSALPSTSHQLWPPRRRADETHDSAAGAMAIWVARRPPHSRRMTVAGADQSEQRHSTGNPKADRRGRQSDVSPCASLFSRRTVKSTSLRGCMIVGDSFAPLRPTAFEALPRWAGTAEDRATPPGVTRDIASPKLCAIGLRGEHRTFGGRGCALSTGVEDVWWASCAQEHTQQEHIEVADVKAALRATSAEITEMIPTKRLRVDELMAEHAQSWPGGAIRQRRFGGRSGSMRARGVGTAPQSME